MFNNSNKRYISTTARRDTFPYGSGAPMIARRISGSRSSVARVAIEWWRGQESGGGGGQAALEEGEEEEGEEELYLRSKTRKRVQTRGAMEGGRAAALEMVPLGGLNLSFRKPPASRGVRVGSRGGGRGARQEPPRPPPPQTPARDGSRLPKPRTQVQASTVDARVADAHDREVGVVAEFEGGEEVGGRGVV